MYEIITKTPFTKFYLNASKFETYVSLIENSYSFG